MDLYTKKGKSLQVVNDRVYTKSGKFFGKIENNKVFGKDGSYVGSIDSGRLVYRSSESAYRSSSCGNYANIGACLKANYTISGIWGDEPSI